MVDKAVAVVMEPAISVVTFVLKKIYRLKNIEVGNTTYVHRMAEEFTSFVVLTNCLKIFNLDSFSSVLLCLIFVC